MHVFPYISEVYTLSVWNITFPLKRGLTAYRVAVRSKGILGKYKTGYWVLHDPSIEYFKCNRKDLGGFRASELFPELSLLLLFLSLDDSQRSFGVWGWELLACWGTAGDPLWALCPGRALGRRLSSGHSSWKVYLPFSDRWFMKSQWRWKSWPKQVAVTQAFSGGKWPTSPTLWWGSCDDIIRPIAVTPHTPAIEQCF